MNSQTETPSVLAPTILHAFPPALPGVALFSLLALLRGERFHVNQPEETRTSGRFYHREFTGAFVPSNRICRFV